MPDYITGVNDPKPNGLISRLTRKITDLISKQKVPGIQAEISSNTSTGMADITATLRYDPQWAVSYARRQIFADLRDMDQNDPIVSTALDVIADCATGYEDDQIDAFE